MSGFWTLMLKAKNRKFSNRIPLGHRYLFYIPLLSSTGSSTHGYRKLVRRPSTRQIQGMYLKCCVEITQLKGTETGVCKLKQSLPLSIGGAGALQQFVHRWEVFGFAHALIGFRRKFYKKYVLTGMRLYWGREIFWIQ